MREKINQQPLRAEPSSMSYQPDELEELTGKCRQCEAELKEQRSWFSKVFQESPVGMGLFNAKAQLLDANPAALKMFGISLKQATGFNFLDHPNFPKEIAKLLQKGETVRFHSALDFEKVKALKLFKTRKAGNIYLEVSVTPLILEAQGAPIGYLFQIQDITESKQAEDEREKLIKELKIALAAVKTLTGLLPICANCKKIRDEQGDWKQLEVYVRDHSQAEFTHGLCPDCAKNVYPEFFEPG